MIGLGFVVPASPADAAAAPLPTPAADVYVVYQGTTTHTEFSPTVSNSAATTEVDTTYAVTDLAFPYNYSVLTVKSDGNYSISTRVLSADGTSMNAYDDGTLDSSADPTQNFLIGLHNNPVAPSTSPTKGYAAFRFSSTNGTSSLTLNNQTHNYPKTTQIYATGALVGLSSTVAVTLVPADAKTKVSGVYTINAIPAAITNYIGTVGNAKTKSYPTALSGPAFFYKLDPTLVATGNSTFPKVLGLGVTGTASVTLNTTLTSLANVGGSFKLKGQVSATTISPVSAPLNSGSSATVYEDFLFEIVKSLGLTTAYTPSP